MKLSGVPGTMWLCALVPAVTTTFNVLRFVQTRHTISLIAAVVCAATLVFILVLIIRWPAK